MHKRIPVQSIRVLLWPTHIYGVQALLYGLVTLRVHAKNAYATSTSGTKAQRFRPFQCHHELSTKHFRSGRFWGRWLKCLQSAPIRHLAPR